MRLSSVLLLVSTAAFAQTASPAPSDSAQPGTAQPGLPPSPVVEPTVAAPSVAGSSAAPTSPASPSPSASGSTAAESASAPEATEPATTAKTTPTVAILGFEANTAARDHTDAIAALVASRLSEQAGLKVISQQDINTALGLERQRQLLSGGTCSSSECLSELSGAVGARFVVTGRVDKFGEKYVLTASVFDSRRGASLSKPRAEASEEGALPDSARELADALLETPGVLSSAGATPVLQQEGRFYVGLRIGSGFFASLAALSPGGDVELGFQLEPAWTPFIQVGFSLLRTGGDNYGELNLLPSLVGLRHYYRTDDWFQPYWGLGLGLQLSFGQYGIFSQTGALPNLLGFGGFRFKLTDRFGLQLEAGTNFAQMILGFGSGGLGDGLNLELTGGLNYVF